jgi:hypothetical protein
MMRRRDPVRERSKTVSWARGIGKVNNAPQAIADIKYQGAEQIAAETERLTRLSAPIKSRVANTFMNAASPGIIRNDDAQRLL